MRAFTRIILVAAALMMFSLPAVADNGDGDIGGFVCYPFICN